MKNIKLKDWNGENFDFFEFQGKNYLLLVFYRGYWCNICRKQLGEINKNKAKFDKVKIKIVAVSPDEPLYASLLSTHLKAKFPILPDPEMKTFKKMKVPVPKDHRQGGASKKETIPAIFLISPEKEIIYQYISKNPEERPDIKEIFKQIKK